MPFPRRWYRPGSGVTGTLAHAVAGSGRESAASDPGHTGTAGCLKFFRPWPGWRQVAWMGRGNQRLRILEEGFTGRCPPCLLGHRRVTRRSASPKLHKSLGNHASQPARRTGRERAEPRRITRTRPTSAPTNGWSRSSTSGIWPTLARWTGPGGASSPTISPPSPTEPGPSRSSGSRPRRPRPAPQAVPAPEAPAAAQVPAAPAQRLRAPGRRPSARAQPRPLPRARSSPC